MFILDYVCGLGHSVERTQRVRKGPQRVSEWLKGFLSEDIVKRFRFFFLWTRLRHTGWILEPFDWDRNGRNLSPNPKLLEVGRWSETGKRQPSGQ